MSRSSGFVLQFLINAAWQIAAVAIGASICARLLRNAYSRYRHRLWVASLVLSVVLPMLGFFDSPNGAPEQISEQRDVPVRTRESLAPTLERSNAPYLVDRVEASGIRLDQLLKTRSLSVVTSTSLALAVAIAYVLFLLYRLIVLWRAWLQAQSLRRSAHKLQLPTPLAAVALRCQATFGLNSVPLVFSTSATTPATVGAWEPAIVLPESLYAETSVETLTTVLGHEMAHIARRDFALNIIYEFLCLPISFHPLTNYLKRQIDRTRELACDEMVTERLLEPQAYARSLVSVAGAVMLPVGRALTLGVFDANILEERIMKLTQNSRRLGARATRLIALCAFSLLCLTGIAASTFSFELQTGASSKVGAGDESATQTTADAQPRSQSDVTQDTNRANLTRAELAHKLSSTVNAQVRAEAACSAGKMRAVEAIPQLIAMLGDDTPIELIKCWEGGRWNPALESFKQPSPGEQAAIALASMGKPALEPLTNALNDSNASVRRNAAWAIGELTNMRGEDRDSAVPPLVSLLRDSDDWVRMASARALGEIRDERAAENLIALLSDGQWQVRKTAAWALGEMKEKRAVEGLCNLLLTDTQHEVRTTSAWALGEMKDKRAIETLCNALASDAQSEVRTTTAWALGEIQSRKAVSFLNQALSDPDKRVREKARWALSEIEDTDQ